jgi:hypothetical protein
MKFKYRCVNCGCCNITWDADAQWDVIAQDKVLVATYDNFTCRDCDAKHIEKVPAEPADLIDYPETGSTGIIPAVLSEATSIEFSTAEAAKSYRALAGGWIFSADPVFIWFSLSRKPSDILSCRQTQGLSGALV